MSRRHKFSTSRLEFAFELIVSVTISSWVNHVEMECYIPLLHPSFIPPSEESKPRSRLKDTWRKAIVQSSVLNLIHTCMCEQCNLYSISSGNENVIMFRFINTFNVLHTIIVIWKQTSSYMRWSHRSKGAQTQVLYGNWYFPWLAFFCQIFMYIKHLIHKTHTSLYTCIL